MEIETFDDDPNDENYHLIYNKFMHNIYLLTMAKNLQRIKKYPLLTFQQKSFSDLWCYFLGMTITFMHLNPYTASQFQNDYQYYEQFRTDFLDYMRNKYTHQYKNWRSVLVEYCNHDEELAFDKFFEEYETFIINCFTL